MIKIEHSCPDIHKRPRVSFEILLAIARAYTTTLESISKKDIYIMISLGDKNRLYLEGKSTYVTEPELIRGMNLYSFTAMVPYNELIESSSVVELYAELVSKCVKEALSKIDKKGVWGNHLESVHDSIIKSKWTKYPYPATFYEQKYVEDSDPIMKEIYQGIYGVKGENGTPPQEDTDQ